MDASNIRDEPTEPEPEAPGFKTRDRQGWGHRLLWLATLLSLAASGVLATLLVQTRSQLDDQKRRVEATARRADDRIDVAADELIDAVQQAGVNLRARQGEVDELRTRLQHLETSLYGFGGAGIGATSIDDLEERIDNLEACVTRNVNSLIFGSGIFYRCG